MLSAPCTPQRVAPPPGRDSGPPPSPRWNSPSSLTTDVLQLTRKLQRAVDRAERAGAQRDATVGRLEQSLAALASQVQGLAFLFEAGGAPARDEGVDDRLDRLEQEVDLLQTAFASHLQQSLDQQRAIDRLQRQLGCAPPGSTAAPGRSAIEAAGGIPSKEVAWQQLLALHSINHEEGLARGQLAGQEAAQRAGWAAEYTVLRRAEAVCGRLLAERLPRLMDDVYGRLRPELQRHAALISTKLTAQTDDLRRQGKAGDPAGLAERLLQLDLRLHEAAAQGLATAEGLELIAGQLQAHRQECVSGFSEYWRQCDVLRMDFSKHRKQLQEVSELALWLQTGEESRRQATADLQTDNQRLQLQVRRAVSLSDDLVEGTARLDRQAAQHERRLHALEGTVAGLCRQRGTGGSPPPAWPRALPGLPAIGAWRPADFDPSGTDRSSADLWAQYVAEAHGRSWSRSEDSLLSPAATATLPDPEDVAEQCQAVVEAMLASVEWFAQRTDGASHPPNRWGLPPASLSFGLHSPDSHPRGCGPFQRCLSTTGPAEDPIGRRLLGLSASPLPGVLAVSASSPATPSRRGGETAAVAVAPAERCAAAELFGAAAAQPPAAAGVADVEGLPTESYPASARQPLESLMAAVSTPLVESPPPPPVIASPLRPSDATRRDSAPPTNPFGSPIRLREARVDAAIGPTSLPLAPSLDPSHPLTDPVPQRLSSGGGSSSSSSSDGGDSGLEDGAGAVAEAPPVAAMECIDQDNEGQGLWVEEDLTTSSTCSSGGGVPTGVACLPPMGLDPRASDDCTPAAVLPNLLEEACLQASNAAVGQQAAGDPAVGPPVGAVCSADKATVVDELVPVPTKPRSPSPKALGAFSKACQEGSHTGQAPAKPPAKKVPKPSLDDDSDLDDMSLTLSSASAATPRADTTASAAPP